MPVNRSISLFVGRLAILAAATALAACAPPIPSHGNFGGPVKTTPVDEFPLPPGHRDKCALPDEGEICWTPFQARFHPDGERMVVNLCSNRYLAQYDCKLVEYRIREDQWRLIPGQEAGKSYHHPSYSNDGKTLVFTTATCEQPFCRGQDEYGQLTLMPVNAQPGQPTVYGKAQPLPVHNASRASFLPGDQGLLYWRVRHVARLSSGRTIGDVAVFAYDMRRDDEQLMTPALYGEKKARFIAPWTGPKLSLDKKVLRFGGITDGLGVTSRNRALFNADPDVEYRVADNAVTDRRTDRVMEGLGRVFDEHPTLGILAGPGNVRLVDLKTLKTTGVFVTPDPYQVVDADIDAKGNQIVAVSGTRAVTDGSYGVKWRYWLQDRDTLTVDKYKDIAPVISLTDLRSGQMRAIEWPKDLTRLGE